MPNNLAHFAINADDTARARGFYQNVFGWQFQAWGPPDFFQISTGDPMVALVTADEVEVEDRYTALIAWSGVAALSSLVLVAVGVRQVHGTGVCDQWGSACECLTVKQGRKPGSSRRPLAAS